MKRIIELKSAPLDNLISVEEFKKALDEADIVTINTLKLKVKISKYAYLFAPVWIIHRTFGYKPFLPKCFVKIEKS